jgi:hypothetical protein
MHSQEALDILNNRVGWDKPLDANSGVVLNSTALTAVSKRKFNSFHQLCTVENIYAAVAVVDMGMEEFNAYVNLVRSQAVEIVLNESLEKNPEYNYKRDYSETLINRASIFDEALGYTVAIQMLELFVSTNRRNLIERNAFLSYQNLKIELEGAKNEAGFYVARGIILKRHKAMLDISKVIFNGPATITGSNGWG